MAVPTVLPAVFSAAAGAIHLALAGDHFDEATRHGAFFLAAGAFQVGWAVAVLVRPTRRVALLGLLNLVVVGVWALSRTVGIDNVDEGIALPDGLATGLELAIVAHVLGRPRLPRAVVLGAVVVVAAATLVSLTPRYADAGHAHDDDGHGDAASAGGDGLAAAGANGQTPNGQTPCEQSGPPVSPAQVTTADGHSHRGPLPQKPIDKATREALAQQQVIARSVADRYPTVADATKRGYKMSTTYVPCIGAHYTNVGLAARFDPAQPAELLFDGTTSDAKLVGLSYLVYHPGGAPEGFAGPNDVWHQHNANGGLCFDRSGVVLAGEDASPEECQALGGVKRELTDVWMLHDWIVPGWECSWGVFAPECPELGGRLGASAWD